MTKQTVRTIAGILFAALLCSCATTSPQHLAFDFVEGALGEGVIAVTDHRNSNQSDSNELGINPAVGLINVFVHSIARAVSSEPDNKPCA